MQFSTPAMKIEPPCAILVDVHHKIDHLDAFLPLVRSITDITDDVTRHCYIYLLTREERDISPLLGNQTIEATNIIGPGRLQCFYNAKRRFDNREVVDVCILCCKPCEEYWKTVCKTLLTPVHAWKIVTTPCDVTTTVDPSSVTDSVKDILTQLPSIGELTVLETQLIPNKIFNHGYSTRNGGITTIPSLASLNLLYTPKKRDSYPTVAENVRRLAQTAKFDANRFHITRTEHGNTVWVVGKDQPEKYDAMVTDQPGLTLAAAGADCTPLIFVDPVKRVCGAAHAGYRGTLKNVAVKTIEAMIHEYGSRVQDIMVTLGPTVGPECFSFDVKDPVVEEFKAVDPSVVEYKGAGENARVTVNIVICNKIHLERAGVDPAHIDTSLASCTACEPHRFYSYERDGFPFGNQIGFVSIKN